MDVGTTRVKLRVYDGEGRLVRSASWRSPLRWRRGLAVHDPAGLRSAVMEAVGAARRLGAGVVGLSLYRASVAAWRPGGEVVEGVVLWLDRLVHREAVRSLPPLARLLSRVPPFSTVFSRLSPLPVISLLHRRHPGARVWTVDALVSEWLGAGYVAEPGAAALTGYYDPVSLRPIPLVASAAGLRGLEAPRVGDSVLPEAPMGVHALLSDQQAATLGSGCGSGGCVKLSLGTGFFADRPLEGRPPRLPGRGLLPVLLCRCGGEARWALESMVPGAGFAVEAVADALGGFEALDSLSPRDCREWDGSLLLPYTAGPGAGVGAWRGLLVGAPVPRGRAGLACAAVAGAVAAASLILSLHGRPGAVHLTGGLAGLRPLRLLLTALLPVETLYCPGDAAPRGAALLAAEAAGLGGGWGPGCEALGRGAGGYERVAEAFAEVLGDPAGDAVDAALEEIRSALVEAADALAEGRPGV